ncbi:MAG: hypothetical protein LBO66_00345 [Deltaproteobacteria bacterium]|jgi:hypothetical protein|nr:hypothetical protein [Deltaproteobacteria bacterium]
MKIALLGGSPKPNGGSSAIILEALRASFAGAAEISAASLLRDGPQASLPPLYGAAAWVLAAPLYVDSLPSHVIRFLEETGEFFERPENASAPRPRLYAIVNCGFYEARQNALAIAALKLFAERSAFPWGRALGIGAGALWERFSPGSWFTRGAAGALAELARDALALAGGEDLFVTANMPRLLYYWGANRSWRALAREKGLKPDALRRAPYS